MTATLGVDVGGTHTDVQLVLDGRALRGKALTTYGDFSQGILDAIEVAADAAGMSLAELLGTAELIVNGTTVVTNSIAEMSGARVGVLVTRGFRDTFRYAGGPRRPVLDDHLQTNIEGLTDGRNIVEVGERIDSEGKVVVAVDDDEVRRAVRDLVEVQGVDCFAVCFLWSHVNSTHEARAAAVIAEMYPDRYVSASHQVSGLRGENRRWTTAVLNAFVHGHAQAYLRGVEARFASVGYAGSLAFFQGLGGSISRERAELAPLSLLNSGPAAGLVGANTLAARMELSDVLVGDMGGTSFDTGLILDNTVGLDRGVQIGPFKTSAALVDVVSVGAGGGSIASVSDRGVPQVGPRSARSTPGPACYARGGTEATVTDAVVAMGLLDPENYLGGRLALRRDLAEQALVAALGARFDWSAEECADAVYQLVVANMANAIHMVTVSRGHDPRDLPFFAYGGTLPLFAWGIAEAVGASSVVIPEHSSVFCARGLVSADFVLRLDQTVSWNLDEPGVDRVNAVARELVERATEEMKREGFEPDELTIRRHGDFKFLGQTYELTLPLPDRDLEPGDAGRLFSAFRDRYEAVYGAGTSWSGVPAQLLSCSVIASAPHRASGAASATASPAGDGAGTQRRASPRRRVFLPGGQGWTTVDVHDGRSIPTGGEVLGPAVIDETDTTVFVPARVVCRRDELMSYVLSEVASASDP